MSRVIWLIGAHQGEDAKPFLQANDKIFCLEANPLMCEKLSLLEGSIFIKHSALVEPSFSDNETTFYISDEKSEWGTLEKSRVVSGSNFTNFKTIKTPVIHLNELVENWDRPEIIICDIEGSEIESFVIPLTKYHIEFFSETLISCEISKDNWREILDLFAQTRHFFSIVVNGEIRSSGNSGLVGSGRGGVASIPHTKLTSSIGSFLSSSNQFNVNCRVFSKSDTERNLEMWFQTKNQAWTFNYDTWLDLIILPSSYQNFYNS